MRWWPKRNLPSFGTKLYGTWNVRSFFHLTTPVNVVLDVIAIGKPFDHFFANLLKKEDLTRVIPVAMLTTGT